MAYAIIRHLGSRVDYCKIEDGILHLTDRQLGDEYPHLVKAWKTKAAAKGVLTRILNKYAACEKPDLYGCITDFTIIPYDRDLLNM